jgi:hypothetical protein
MPTPASEEERIICASDDCDATGEYRNDYLRGLYCLNCHEGIMDNYYSSDDDDDNDNDDEDSSNRYIHNYGYKPRASFMRSDGTHSLYVTKINPNVNRTTLTMGFELETENTGDHSNYDMAGQLLGAVNNGNESDIYIKEDGSLYNGFEIVSHPGELDYFMNHFKWAGIEQLARDGFRAWTKSSCGLHIHVAKSAFADTSHKFKFMAFVYKNRFEMVQFAGRESDNYASYDIKRFLNSHRDWIADNGTLVRGTNMMKFAKGEDVNNSRSMAVNLQPDKTIELRLFRPSLKSSTVKACLQFCHALFHYTETITTREILQEDALKFKGFKSWVAKQGDVYALLDTRITERVKFESTGGSI